MRRDARRPAWRVETILSVTATIALGCGSPPAIDASGRWSCPASWVPHARGGCGPAVLLCVPGGGAADGVCNGLDLAHLGAATDGGSSGFRVLPDGGIGGAWPEEDQSPTAPTFDRATSVGGVGTCPALWTLRNDRTCDPNLNPACPTDTAALPGGACTATGVRACGASEYADPGAEAVGHTVVRVREGADPSVADGSVARPYGTVQGGIDAAGADGFVLVAAGTYREALVARGLVHIVGRCPTSVTIEPPDGSASISASSSAVDVDLRGVRLLGGGIVVDTGAHARLRSVRVTRALSRGIYVTGVGSVLRGEDVFVDETRTDADGARGRGAQVSLGARLELSRAVVARSHGVGVFANEGGTMQLEDVVVRDTQGTPAARASGITAEASTGVMRRVVSQGNMGWGVRAARNTSRLSLDDCVVRDQLPVGGYLGRGLEAIEGASLVATRVSVSASLDTGVFGHGPGTHVELRACSVIGTRLPAMAAPGVFGRGLECQDGARCDVVDSWFDQNRDTGIFGTGTGTTINMSNTGVWHTIAPSATPQSPDPAGWGLGVESGASLVARGAHLFENHGGGAVSVGANTSLTLDSCAIVSTIRTTPSSRGEGVRATDDSNARIVHCRFDANDIAVFAQRGAVAVIEDSIASQSAVGKRGSVGIGFASQRGGRVVVRRSLVDGIRGLGISAWGAGSRADVEDSTIRGGEPNAAGDTGRALNCVLGATIAATRVRLIRNHEVAALSQESGSNLVLRDVLVRDVLPNRGAFGHGLSSQEGGNIDAAGVLVENAAEFGIAANMGGGQVRLFEVIVRGIVPTTRGFGAGIGMFGPTFLSASRIAIEGVVGAGIVSASTVTVPMPGMGGASFVARDVFVSRIQSGAILTIVAGGQRSVVSQPLAYGVHVTDGNSIEIEQALIVNGGYGLFASGGNLFITRGVIALQLDGAAAYGGPDGVVPLHLTDVLMRDNATNDVRRAAGLPEAVLQPPTGVCLGASCN